MSTVKEAEKTETPPEAPKALCAVQQAIEVWSGFLDEKMCGKCHPCMLGSDEVLRVLQRIADGSGASEDLAHLQRISDEMRMGSRCKKGKDVATTLADALSDAGGEFSEHIADGRCRHLECASLIEYRIDPERCTLCGDCLKACKYTAIAGEKREGFAMGYLPLRVRQNRCVRCDECRIVCPEDAVSVVTGRKTNP